MAKQYIKCNFYEKAPMMTFDDEYLITFKIKNMNKVNPSALIGPKGKEIEFPARDEEWCIVSKGGVTPLSKSRGLVRIIDLEINEVTETAQVAIKNLDGITYFSVPLDEIVIE